MNIKWQWFAGGQIMFWEIIISIVLLVFVFMIAYVIDLITIMNMDLQRTDITAIKTISEEYVKNLDIKINKKIIYRFVQFKDKNILGTFHEWNNKYYIDISTELLDDPQECEAVVIHETRHLIVEYLRDMNVIDLTKYTEEIAESKNKYYNSMFLGGVYLLKNKK